MQVPTSAPRAFLGCSASWSPWALADSADAGRFQAVSQKALLRLPPAHVTPAPLRQDRAHLKPGSSCLILCLYSLDRDTGVVCRAGVAPRGPLLRLKFQRGENWAPEPLWALQTRHAEPLAAWTDTFIQPVLPGTRACACSRPCPRPHAEGALTSQDSAQLGGSAPTLLRHLPAAARTGGFLFPQSWKVKNKPEKRSPGRVKQECSGISLPGFCGSRHRGVTSSQSPIGIICEMGQQQQA